jgi:hypothetical protein
MTVPYIDKSDPSLSPEAYFAGVPACLEPWLVAKTWVLWRWQLKKGRHTKPPLQIDGRSPASTSDPNTWGRGVDAIRSATAKGQGVGLVLSSLQDLVALDLDNARSWDGVIAPWAAQLIARAGSYTEVSPSGTGFRIFGRSKSSEPIGTTVKFGGGHVEVFRQTNRYVTVTGEQSGPHTELADLDDLLDELVPVGKPKASVSSTNCASDEAHYQRLVGNLRPEVEERAGRPGGPSDDRSATFQSITNVLKLKGFNVSDALRYFSDRPNGPASKYIEGGRLEVELARSWAKARTPDEGCGATAIGAGGTKPKLVLEPWGSIDFDLNSDEFLIEGILPGQGLATLYGPPKSYKSFIGMDMALAVAQGLPWGDCTVKQGAVVYVAGEGVAGLRKRVKAFRIRHELYGQNLPFFLVSARLNLGVAAGDTQELIDAVRAEIGEERPALIVIDTLARMLSGQSENAEGMFNFVNNAEALSDELGCVVLAVHHEGKNAEAGMRGSSNLLGAVVAAIRVKRASDGLRATLTVEAAKDGDDDIEAGVTLEKFELGHSAKGRAVSTLLVKSVAVSSKGRVERVDRSERRPPPIMTALIRAFEDVLFDNGEAVELEAGAGAVQCVPLEALRERYFDLRGDDDAAPDSKRRAFDRHMGQAVDRVLFRVVAVSGKKLVWKP